MVETTVEDNESYSTSTQGVGATINETSYEGRPRTGTSQNTKLILGAGILFLLSGGSLAGLRKLVKL